MGFLTFLVLKLSTKVRFIEISSEQFYEGGVLFKDLHMFLTNAGFILQSPPTSNHCDVIYLNSLIN